MRYFLFLTKKQKKNQTQFQLIWLSLSLYLFLVTLSKSAASWHSIRFPFQLSHKLSLLSVVRGWSFLAAAISFLPSTALCRVMPPSLSARCSNVYLDHLLLTLLIEDSLLLCALWPIVCFTLASFYKGRMSRKQLRRRRRHKRSRFRRCSQLNSCCVTALNKSEICWRWKIKELDRNNDMIGVDFIALMLCYKKSPEILLNVPEWRSLSRRWCLLW